MSFHYQRSYRGKLKGVIFDWAGTMIDFGCMAPAGAFVDLFARHGIAATQAEARGPMGMHKRDHIRTMLGMPAIARQWAEKHGHAATEAEIEALFQEFIPMQLEVLPNYCVMIPGVVETARALRARGLKLGGTTGYNDVMMNICLEAARKAGYEPDTSVCGIEVPEARPAPWMAIKAAMQMNIYPLEAVVKVGDTVTDILEGLNGGMWSVGITRTGNEVGLSEADFAALTPAEAAARVAVAHERLAHAGAHYVIESVADLPPVLDAIEARLARGERP